MQSATLISFILFEISNLDDLDIPALQVTNCKVLRRNSRKMFPGRVGLDTICRSVFVWQRARVC